MPPSEQSSAAFQPAQMQRWNLFQGFKLAMDTPAARWELRAWCGLAVGALAIAGVFALLLAVSRVPGAGDAFPWPTGFFQKGLVIHVVFSFVVWFLAVYGAVTSVAAWRLADGRAGGGGLIKVAVAASVAASVMLFLPALLDRGEASLNNYVPVIIDPIYHGGLALLAVAVAGAVLRLTGAWLTREGPVEPVAVTALYGGAVYVLAMLCFIFALGALEGNISTGADNEDLFWGGGHALQFLNTLLMLGGWYVLGGLALERPLVDPRLFRIAAALPVLAALALPVFYFTTEAFSAQQTQLFTDMQYALGLPVLVVAGAAVATLANHTRRGAGLPWRDTAFLALVLSFAVFVLGGVLGLFVDGGDARTPAHYHGVIGGVNLAFMGVFYRFFLPLLGDEPASPKARNISIIAFAAGQALHSIGLFIAGGYGAPRKVTAAEYSIDALAAKAGTYAMGVGALIAVTGGVMFIWIVARVLLRRA